MSLRRRNRFKFTEKTQSTKGIIALSVASALLFLYLIFLHFAFVTKGGLSVYIGSVGVLAMLATIANFVISIQSMLEENSFQAIPRASLVVTIIEAICWFGTFYIGLR